MKTNSRMSGININYLIASLLILNGASSQTFANGLQTCEQALNDTNQLEKLHNGKDVESPIDPYAYPDYHGPPNAILQRFLNTPFDQRSPRFANACKNGKVIPLEDVLEGMGLHIKTQLGIGVGSFVDGKDPMHLITTRANFYKSGGRSGDNSFVTDWLEQQYPDLIEPLKVWYKSTLRPDGATVDFVDPQLIENWFKDHPEYRNGLLVFPKPTLWNRIGAEHDRRYKVQAYESARPYKQAISAAREFKIETIAALFDSRLAEAHFDDLRFLLVKMAGPHSFRISQAGVVKKIAEWVLTQYPELEVLTTHQKNLITPDQLTESFGRTLGLIPVAWANGDLTQTPPENNKLAEVPSSWEQTVLPKILGFTRGLATPRIQPKRFMLKDPTTGERRLPKSGDEIQFSFLPSSPTPGDEKSPYSSKDIFGVIHSSILKNNEVVGFYINIRGPKARWSSDKEEPLTETPVAFWLEDFEVEDSIILNSGNSEAVTVRFDDLKFPEDSGEITFHYGPNQQAPVSVGDLIQLSLKTAPRNRYPFTLLIVTGFERDENGVVTALRGYDEDDYSFTHIRNIEREADGTPRRVSLQSKTIDLKEKAKEVTIPLSEIIRTDSTTHLYFELKPSLIFKLPASPKRQPWDYSRVWHRSQSRDTVVRQDSGPFMLRIGMDLPHETKTRVYQSPVAPGDEVLIYSDAPGTLLTFDINRILVESIDFENGKPVGLSGTDILKKQPESWKFSQIDQTRSYIETNPWHGDRANSTPGAFAKRVEYKGTTNGVDDVFTFFKNAFFGQKNQKKQEHSYEDIEDLFGYRFTTAYDDVKAPEWTEKPMSYDDWLEANRFSNHIDSKLKWAYWVLKVTPETPWETVQIEKRKFAKKLHPDYGGDAMSMAAINDAYKILKDRHPKPAGEN